MSDSKFDLNESVSVLFEKFEKLLTSKTVIGEPIKIGEATLIPFISTSFGLGSGGGNGYESKGAHSVGGGAGLGAKISPTAVLVIKGDQVEMIPIKKSGGFEKLIDMVPDIASKFNCIKKDDEKEKEKEEQD
ncbi:MAG TPA: spore germination protein GerW family protein [Acetivibrio clariflavus]|nr:spore germination protein GerW family protein [Acetivibrio clariflavus]